MKGETAAENIIMSQEGMYANTFHSDFLWAPHLGHD